ncbi:hypothetical protein FKP32DRAFT_1679513 [Trametes sanguinea]|nr:hypothetical protein FKP32DRAFT_1679513 [Trametes sanguinea]
MSSVEPSEPGPETNDDAPFGTAPSSEATHAPDTDSAPQPSKGSRTSQNAVADLAALEGYIHSTIWSYGYNGALSFRCDPASMDVFVPMEQQTLADFNVGLYALSDHPCNTDFLEHEKWSLCMLTEVSTLPAYDDELLETRRSELLQTISNELVRLQTHKEVEWQRQRANVKQCKRIGVPFFDSGK